MCSHYRNTVNKCGCIKYSPYNAEVDINHVIVHNNILNLFRRYSYVAYCIKPIEWKPITGSLVITEDPYEMPHDGSFHYGLHCLVRYNPGVASCGTWSESVPCFVVHCFVSLLVLQLLDGENRVGCFTLSPS